MPHMSLYDLVRNNEHEKIARLDGEEFNLLKTVAYINMGKFSEAIKYAPKNSFELAYIFYKLKKYKRALRILRHIDTEGSRVLSSQCLYYLGYYNNAYKILSKIKKDDDIVINLQAMKSLAILAHESQYKFGNKFLLRKMDDLTEFEDLSVHEMQTTEGYVDFIFNLSFENLSDESKFVKFLEDHVKDDDKLRETIVWWQLKNIEGDFDGILVDGLSKGQRETLEFNKGAINRFSHPLHFQQNFLEFNKDDSMARHNECLWIENVYKTNFKIRFDKIPGLSRKMMMIRALVMYKNGGIPHSKEMGDIVCGLRGGWIKMGFSIIKGICDGNEFDREAYIKMLDGIRCDGSFDFGA